MIFDTGSSDLTADEADCLACPPTASSYIPSNRAVDTHISAGITYESATILGDIGEDSVQWGDSTYPNITFLKANFDLELATAGSCEDDLTLASPGAGILGMSRDAVARTLDPLSLEGNGTGFMTQISRESQQPNCFATRFCQDGGTVLLAWLPCRPRHADHF